MGADSDDEDDEGEEAAPLAAFNPFLQGLRAPSPPPSTPRAAPPSSPLPSASSPSLPIVASLSSTSTSIVDVTQELQALADEEERRKRKGVIAADLLSHYGGQKSVQDEERERTRKRERSKWDHSNEPNHLSRTRDDGGGVMVGGLGLDPADTSASPLPPPPRSRRRRGRGGAAAAVFLTADADSERSASAAGEMPDMSDFIKLYEDEDEPSYPSMLWRAKERLTRAVDVPQPVLDEVAHFDRQRAALRGGRRPTTRLPRVRAEEAQVRLRFNLGEGRRLRRGGGARPARRASSPSRLPHLPAVRGQGQRYGRQWYLPVRRVAGERRSRRSGWSSAGRRRRA